MKSKQKNRNDSNSSIIRDLNSDEQSKRGWKVIVNGELIDEVSSVKLQNERMGIEVAYGMRQEGFDSILIRESSGAATIPYMINNKGHIYIGIVEEFRPTMGEPTTQNIPRGFSDLGEDKQQTAIRELVEETGYDVISDRVVQLSHGLNPNSSYFDFSENESDGVDLFSLRVSQDELEVFRNDDGEVYYEFPARIQEQATNDAGTERIIRSRFIPIENALQSRDMFTSAATGQLLGYLLMRGEHMTSRSQDRTAE